MDEGHWVVCNKRFESATDSIVVHWKTCSRGVPVFHANEWPHVIEVAKRVGAIFRRQREMVAHAMARPRKGPSANGLTMKGEQRKEMVTCNHKILLWGYIILCMNIKFRIMRKRVTFSSTSTAMSFRLCAIHHGSGMSPLKGRVILSARASM